MDNAKDDLKYWVALHTVTGIGRVRMQALEAHFGTMEAAWKGSPSELRAAGLDTRSLNAIVSARSRTDPDAEMERLERYKVKALTWKDPSYPPRLKEIYDFPPVLYIKGTLLPEDEWSVAVVGTRRATAYGREVAETLTMDLARNGIIIVSGLARGIDATAHRAALKAGGRTIAVEGCGLDMVYPGEHTNLAREILEHGALVSDYPLGTQPKAEHFPRRNRILSGLSLGTLVVEAGDDSGALITARLAMEQNREVFAVPGNILTPVSLGTNRLIQDGAKLVIDFRDILEELNLSANAKQMELPGLVAPTDVESVIMKYLAAQPVHIDELRRQSGLSIDIVSSSLAMMELKGLVKQVGGMTYILTREARAEYQTSVN